MSPALISYHAHSTEARLERLLAFLSEGRDVALVTDAGTPGISDPGAVLVAAARAAGHLVVPIPGASAVATALSASGLSADRYLFLGFLPRKGAERARMLSRAATEEWCVVFFEAAPRLVALLQDLAQAAGPDRSAVVARELTKMHEEFRAGSLGDLADYYSENDPRGEVTVVMRGTGGPAPVPDRTGEALTLGASLLAEGLSRREIVRRLSASLGIPRNEAYRLVMELP